MLQHIKTAGTYAVYYQITASNYKNKTGSAIIQITPKDINKLNISADTTQKVYDGTEKRPNVTVKDGNTTLTLDTDYMLSYANNINAGIAKVIVTGKENYTGTKEITFEIIEVDDENLIFDSDIYDIGTSEIKNILPNTLVSDFKNNVTTNATIEFYDKDGDIMDTNDYLSTGSKIKIMPDGKEYKLIVAADLNGDGKITTTDLLKIKKHIIGLQYLEDCYSEAADINLNGKVTTTDLLKMKKIIVGLNSL